MATGTRPWRADDLHRDPPVRRVPRSVAGAGSGRRHHRCGADPEPRHDRRQHRQRLAGRRHAARACWRLTPSSSWVARAASGRSRRTSSGRRIGSRIGPPTSCCSSAHSAAAGPPGPLPQGRYAPRPGDLEGRAGPRLARGRWRLARCPAGPGLGRRHAGPGQRRRRACSRVPRRASRRPTTLPPPWPPRSTRSTTCVQQPITGGRSPRASCTGCLRDEGGW